MREYTEGVLAEVELGGEHSRSRFDEEPFRRPWDNLGRAPTSGGKRQSLGLSVDGRRKDRPETPVDDTVKKVVMNKFHAFSRASTLDDEVEQVEKATRDAVKKATGNAEAWRQFKQDCFMKEEMARRRREWEDSRNARMQAANWISGYARAKASQSPVRKRFVLDPGDPRQHPGLADLRERLSSK